MEKMIGVLLMAEKKNSDEILYPLDHMSETAASILADASYAQQQHDIQWAALQTFIQNNFSPQMRDTLTTLLQPYANHLRASLDWQMNLATAIFDAVDAMSGVDSDVAHTFGSPSDPNNHHYHGFT
jgi:hypothetical protein